MKQKDLSKKQWQWRENSEECLDMLMRLEVNMEVVVQQLLRQDLLRRWDLVLDHNHLQLQFQCAMIILINKEDTLKREEMFSLLKHKLHNSK